MMVGMLRPELCVKRLTVSVDANELEVFQGDPIDQSAPLTDRCGNKRFNHALGPCAMRPRSHPWIDVPPGGGWEPRAFPGEAC